MKKRNKLVISAVVLLWAVVAIVGLMGIRHGRTAAEDSIQGSAPQKKSGVQEKSKAAPLAEVCWSEEELSSSMTFQDTKLLGEGGAVCYQQYVAIDNVLVMNDGENLRTYITFPVLNGYENKNLEQWWNQYFRRISGFDQVKNDPGIQSLEEYNRTTQSPSGNEVSVDIRLMTSHMISFEVSTYSEDGAHPTFSYHATTLDLNTGKTIPMMQLFKPGYKEAFKQIVKEQIAHGDNTWKGQEYGGEDLGAVMLQWMETCDTTAGIEFTPTALIFSLDPRLHGYPELERDSVSVEIPLARVKELILPGGYLGELPPVGKPAGFKFPQDLRVGKVTWDMEENQVREALGQPQQIQEGEIEGLMIPFKDYIYSGIRLRLYLRDRDNDGQKEFRVGDVDVEMAELDHPTARGIHVGDSKEDVLALYGEPDEYDGASIIYGTGPVLLSFAIGKDGWVQMIEFVQMFAD